MKNAKYGELRYSIRILSNGDETYSVEVPKLPGCYSQGRTKNECLANIIEAIELHLEGVKKRPPEDSIPAIEVLRKGPSQEDFLVSLPEACRLLDISDATIRRYIRRGKIPTYSFGKEYKFKLRELYAFVDSAKVKASPRRRAS